MVSCTWTVDAPSACPIAGSDGRYMSMVSGPSAVRNDSSNVRLNVPGRSIVLYRSRSDFIFSSAASLSSCARSAGAIGTPSRSRSSRALRAAVAGQADFIDAGEPLRLAKIIHMAIDFGGERRKRYETCDVDRHHEMPGIGLAFVVSIEVDHVAAKSSTIQHAAEQPSISARPAPLYSPIGSKMPSPERFGSVIDSPVPGLTNQPSGMVSPRSAYFFTVP